MSRSILFLLMKIFAVIASVAIALVFFMTMTPSERSAANLPRVKLPLLKREEFAFVHNSASLDNWPSDLLFVRQKNGELDVWDIPGRDGTHTLPDMHWWRPGPQCKKFLPNFEKKVIACEDEYMSDWGKEAFRWTIDGKNISRNIDDMMRINGVEEAGDYVLFKSN